MKTVRTETTTTIVNAAFLQEIKESNLQLWSVVNELRNLRDDWEDSRELAKRFVIKVAELRDHIAVEFSLEETYGFMEGYPNERSFGVADAALARMQHRELYLQLLELCEAAEEAQYRGTIARDLNTYLDAYQEYDAAFRAHEALEDELIRCGLGFQRSTLNS